MNNNHNSVLSRLSKNVRKLQRIIVPREGRCFDVCKRLGNRFPQVRVWMCMICLCCTATRLLFYCAVSVLARRCRIRHCGVSLLTFAWMCPFAMDFRRWCPRYDACLFNGGVASRARYLAMSRALNATGRQIFYSVEGWSGAFFLFFFSWSDSFGARAPLHALYKMLGSSLHDVCRLIGRRNVANSG